MTESAQTMGADPEDVVRLIREGWDNLRLQSPLAAWGSWQEAIRLAPDSRAAQQALSTLESAGELPAAARMRYRFMGPDTAVRRGRWDARLRGTIAEALTGAAKVFSDLTEEDPGDAEAWYNRALCLGWIGQNREAIACLDRFVSLRADSAFETAVSAWILAEILRQGRGAESLADDLRFSASIPWSARDSERFVRHLPGLRHLPTPFVPTSDTMTSPSVKIFEWLDEPSPLLATTPQDLEKAAEGTLLLATVYESDRSLRLSSPRADTLEKALERLARITDLESREIQREAAPLPLPFLDAAVWTFRIAGQADAELVDRLTREHVESYFENHWIHGKRHGLDGLSPFEASALAASGDRVIDAKLTAVIRLREQLATRPSVGGLYQGYPFDRLRTRLSVEPADGVAFDSEDLASASAAKLGQLDPASLPDVRLVAAFESADGLLDDRLTEKFANELAGRTSEARLGVDLPALVACLVRRLLARGESRQALDLIGRLGPETSEADRRRLDVWRAEILAREGRGVEAAALYRELLEADLRPAILALDAAETLLDNHEHSEARFFLEQAVQAAREEDLKGIESRAMALLDALDRTA